MDYDQQRMAAAEQWTNDIQASDAGGFIYIPMPSQYSSNAHEPSENGNSNFIGQRNHLFAGRPAKQSIIQRTLTAQSIPSLQYSSYAQLPATVPVQYPYQKQQQQHYYNPIAYKPTTAQQSVDEYLLHGEMPLPKDQTYIVSNAAPNIPTNAEPDYLT